jgi:hypothetical protein
VSGSLAFIPLLAHMIVVRSRASPSRVGVRIVYGVVNYNGPWTDFVTLCLETSCHEACFTYPNTPQCLYCPSSTSTYPRYSPFFKVDSDCFSPYRPQSPVQLDPYQYPISVRWYGPRCLRPIYKAG